MTTKINTPSFQPGETVVYPSHGVGVITAIEEQEIAGFELQLLAITLEKDRLTVRIPLAKAKSSGLRKLSDPAVIEQALGILSEKAKAKRGMWNRRATDFQERMATGQLTAMAEVLRDLNRGSEQTEASYSEQQIFETALDFMAREIAAVRGVTHSEARQLIATHLAKAPHLNTAA
ncbi:CarD family transcriptional regulator [Microvirga sp. BT688]|uniref:CarD family transcriptional regulator n=1 Tax=Microvirga sp. TaxID=1873136 RepID=UPI00168796B3|nr:CarD family transcriptional regulator [Microvirga sp.]MBD2745998.1 CarD family transcriptional regulator [Microvirga sp.]